MCERKAEQQGPKATCLLSLAVAVLRDPYIKTGCHSRALDFSLVLCLQINQVYLKKQKILLKIIFENNSLFHLELKKNQLLFEGTVRP